MIKGISVLNPVDVEKDYLLYTVDYAIKNGFNHFQLIGPIHNYVKGNIDGMINYRKYSNFNAEKDSEYISYCMEAVNDAFKTTRENGVKTYMWHHELYLPTDFSEVYPEILNDCGDIEITHPLVKDFIENKIKDFYDAYPSIDGIILTLHETQVPLLKLKNQKLPPVERVKYITKILYDSCIRSGKELIVRNFASLEEDNKMMTKAYEEISRNLFIMDKWTQFDWSLTMPGNPFFAQIKNNPLFVEADIFGEFFGKGRVPLMLANHIKKQFAHCEKYNPAGYVARIDRNGQIPFDEVNEVNLEIMKAYIDGADSEPYIEKFFEEKYPQAASEVRKLMENTEDILTKIIYIKNYLFSELSIFPTLNHCKNHFYFEMMKKDALIASDEWFIPKDWKGCTHKEVTEDKLYALKASEKLFDTLLTLKDRIEPEEYNKLFTKFANLKLIAKAWYQLALIHINYVKYFEEKNEKYETLFKEEIAELKAILKEGETLLGDKFYCLITDYGKVDCISRFTDEAEKSFEYEKKITEKLRSENHTDFIICGGAMEGHSLKKEVNFSDTFVNEMGISRIPGNRNGEKWSTVNSHGWFSYLIAVKPDSENTISFTVSNPEGEISLLVTIGDKPYTIKEKAEGKKVITLKLNETEGKDNIRIRFDRNSRYTPYIYDIKVN